MRWKTKARIQNAVSLLPSRASYSAYYWIQRRFGNLKRIDPTGRLRAGVEIWRRILQQGRNPRGGTFLEIGTGHVPITPLAFWLMGAEQTITIDVNPYVQVELVRESIQHIATHSSEVEQLFGPLLVRDRFDDLLGRTARLELPAFLDLCRIQYVAPGDAGRTDLPAGSVDFKVSYNVFEHVEPEDLKRIMLEGNRVVAEDGLFVHRIDYSDHFSHSDKTISAINFLQFSDHEWGRYAGNRYMYLNRLRHDDYVGLLESAGRRLVDVECNRDPVSLELLESGKLRVHERFASRPSDALAIRDAWIVARKAAS